MRYVRLMPRALIIGGTGLIGRATARRLLAAGWQVELTGRDPAHLPDDIAAAGGVFVPANHHDPVQLHAALGHGVDLLVDCICYTAAHATGLLPLARAAGSTVMISSNAVYLDEVGNHANSDVRPHFTGSINERQPTVTAGNGDYNSRQGYGANKVAAEQVLLDSGCPVTVLRPSKIHGAGAVLPREWYFVKRVLDRRPAVLLAHGGKGIRHTTAAANIAALIEVVAACPGRRILNSADPDAPNGLQIARTIARHLGREWDEVLLDADAPLWLGNHPWDAPYPVVLDLSAASELGYLPVGDYAATVVEELDWLVWISRGEGAARLPPGLDEDFFVGSFDYEAEDDWLARLAR